MTALPESPDLSETRLQEIETAILDVLMSGAISHTSGEQSQCPKCQLREMADELCAEVRRLRHESDRLSVLLSGTERDYAVSLDKRAELESALTAARAEREESRARAVQGEERETHYLALSSAALLMFAAEGRYGMCTPEWWEAHNNVMQTMRRVFFPSARTSTPAPSKGNSTQRKCPDCGRTDFAKRLSVSHVLCECGTQYWRDHLPQERKRVSLPVEGTVDA